MKKKRHAMKKMLQKSLSDLKNSPFIRKGNKAANIKYA